MRILWGALRAVSVEMVGVMAVLWMLHSATDLAIDAPWRTTRTPESVSQHRNAPSPEMARREPALAFSAPAEIAQVDPDPNQDATQRATMRQWFTTLFPAGVDKAPPSPQNEQRTEYARERLDHYSRLYGIASRD